MADAGPQIHVVESQGVPRGWTPPSAGLLISTSGNPMMSVLDAALDGRKEDAENAIGAMSVREQDDLWHALAALLGTLHDDHGWGWPCDCGTCSKADQ